MKNIYIGWIRFLAYWLCSAILFFIFDGSLFFLLLIAMTLLPLFSFLSMRICRDKINITLQQHQSDIKLIFTKPNWFPFAFITLNCNSNNVFYQEGNNENLCFMSGAQITYKLNVPITTCGKYDISIQQYELKDLLGLFRKRVSQNIQLSIMKYPAETVFDFQPLNEEIEGLQKNRHTPNIGTDFELHEYQPNEPIRHVHHKMSYKLSKLMVKKYDPISEKKLSIFLDLSGEKEQIEKALSIFYSYCLTNIEQNRALSIIWETSSSAYRSVIIDFSDVITCLDQILSIPRSSLLAFHASTNTMADILISAAGIHCAMKGANVNE